MVVAKGPCHPTSVPKEPSCPSQWISKQTKAEHNFSVSTEECGHYV